MKRGSQLLYPPPKYGQISSIWRLLCLDQLSLLLRRNKKILNKLHPIWIENLFIDSAERMPVKSAPHSKTTSLSTSLSSTRQPLFPRSLCLVSNLLFAAASGWSNRWTKVGANRCPESWFRTMLKVDFVWNFPYKEFGSLRDFRQIQFARLFLCWLWGSTSLT